MRLLLLLCLLLWASAGHACLWDSDTLATEAKGLPDVVQIITGRFERNPPLYYQMQLERVTKELKTQPGKLELYDDAGVASDRLGQGAQAIQWMQQKRAALDKLGYNAQTKEYWYRYHANLGTFLAHDWLRSGANRKNLKPMLQARDHIKRAIQINPNAHFGREKYQLMAMEWIIKPPKTVMVEEIPSFVTLSYDKNIESVKGISGLIALGAAWEIIDVFYALQNSLAGYPATIGYLANLRSQELARQGKHSLYPGAPTGNQLTTLLTYHANNIAIDAKRRPDIEKEYIKLRAEADEYQKRRTDYMLARLKVGRHPDTDPTFWNEWQDAGPPVIDEPLSPAARRAGQLNLALKVTLVAFSISLVLSIRRVVQQRRTTKIGITLHLLQNLYNSDSRKTVECFAHGARKH